jgi:hypothetical protein
MSYTLFPMITKKMQQLEAAKAKIANLENAIAAELGQELARLPAKFGFSDVKSFLKAVKAAGGGKRRGKAAKATKKSAGGKKRRTRAVITDATRAEVKKLVEAGKTGGQIAKAVGISLPSVQNIKKALGLVKKR